MAAFFLTGLLATAQGNGNGNGNQETFVVSQLSIVEGQNGTPDELLIRLSVPAGNGNGATSLSRFEIDTASISDENGVVELQLYGGCCCCLTVTIVVRSKPKK